MLTIDAVVENARIRTLDPERPTAQRMGIWQGRIIGFDEELDGIAARQRFDLQGAPVLPGFHDAHNHLSKTGERLAAVNLRPTAVKTLDELYQAIAEHAATLAPDAWIRAAGYDQNALGDHPSAEELDKVCGGRPAILEHVSGHMIVANTAAFERAGWADRLNVPDVDGGRVVRDDQQRAHGLLEEKAMGLIMSLVRPSPEEEVVHWLDLGSQQALSYGLTTITEPGAGDPHAIGNSPLDFHYYQRALEQGVLGTRMVLMPYCGTLHELPEIKDSFGLDLGIRTGLGDDRLRVGPVKIWSDGSYIGRSAAMHRCYVGEPENTGYLQYAESDLRKMIIQGHLTGWTVATHAIGDAAIDHVLDAFAEAQRLLPRPEVRHRIEHFALTSPEQVERAAQLGVVPVPQGVFISDFGDGMAAATDAELHGGIYRLKSLLKAGHVLPGSTDSPVSDANPLRCIHDMVNRHTASGALLGLEERLTVQEAVQAYTYGSAYAAGAENDMGSLSTGKLADFVVLSDDLFSVAEEKISQVDVGATFVGGELVYNEAGINT